MLSAKGCFQVPSPTLRRKCDDELPALRPPGGRSCLQSSWGSSVEGTVAMKGYGGEGSSNFPVRIMHVCLHRFF